MRTAILVAGFFIASAIESLKKESSNKIGIADKFAIILFFVFLVMDIAECSHYLK